MPPLANPDLYVITGGPGSGKTTVLSELARLGYRYVPEAARQIIQEQVSAGGRAVPWDDREAYTRLMLDRSIESFVACRRSSGIIFSDRGIPDTLCYARMIGLRDERAIYKACLQYRYAPLVFIAPPWREIYETDAERKQDFPEAQRTFEEMTRVYRELGYELRELPRLPPRARADFILEGIQTRTTSRRER